MTCVPVGFVVSPQSADHLAAEIAVNLVLNSSKLMTDEAEGIQSGDDAATGKLALKIIHLLIMMVQCVLCLLEVY